MDVAAVNRSQQPVAKEASVKKDVPLEIKEPEKIEKVDDAKQESAQEDQKPTLAIA